MRVKFAVKKIALNYIYLSEKHAGGKDQVGLNLLRGFYENGFSKNMLVICNDYSKDMILDIAPDVMVISIKSRKTKNELQRMAWLCWTNTVTIPKIIKKHKIDLIYHLSCNNGLRKLKTISVVIPHDIKAIAHRVLGNVKVPLYKYLIYKIMYHVDFKHADHIIAISDTDKKEISTYYSKFQDKITRIYNPINVDIIKKDPRQKENYITALNLQFHHKNIITLIKAFELIKDQIDCKLYLMGSVPKRVHYLEEYVEEHNLGDKIIFTGFIPDEEMRKKFVNSSLYVNPTLYEGFGMTAVEAIILKVPTLISKIPTNYEITQGLCEYYEPVEDERALANKILECLSKKYDEVKLENASSIVWRTYNYLEISKQYQQHFKKFLEQGHK